MCKRVTQRVILVILRVMFLRRGTAHCEERARARAARWLAEAGEGARLAVAAPPRSTKHTHTTLAHTKRTDMTRFMTLPRFASRRQTRAPLGDYKRICSS